MAPCSVLVTEGGLVTAFMAQYETVIDGKPVPVVRYDTAHGFPHLDVLDRHGRVVDKVRLASQATLGIALTYALQDIADTWPAYREVFFKDEP